MKKVFIYIFAIGMCLTFYACPDSDPIDEIIENENNNNDDNEEKEDTTEEEDKIDVELTYKFNCYDLPEFVTPVITYFDAEGTHSITLDDDTWSPTLMAYCSYIDEDGRLVETVEEAQNVPSSWNIENTYNYYKWEQIVKLNQFGIKNHFIVSYKRKENYTIDPNRKYKLSHSSACSEAKSYLNGKKVFSAQYFFIDIGISINIGGGSSSEEETKEELEKYLDEICSKNDTVTMIIEDDGRVTYERDK